MKELTITIPVKSFKKFDNPYDSKAMAAKYQLIMDTAEQEITDEYRSSGTLTSARVCDINRGMDDYVLSVQAVMSLMEKAKAEGGK